MLMFTRWLPESTVGECPFHVASGLLICKISTVMLCRGTLVWPFNTWGGGGGGGGWPFYTVYSLVCFK